MNYPILARKFYLEPLALEASAFITAHNYIYPRITGQIDGSRDFIEPQQAADKPSVTSIKRDGSQAHLRQQMAMPAMQSNGPWSPPTIVDPNYFWTIDGKPGVAVIPVNGMLMKGAGSFQESCMGVVNPDRISHALSQAMADKSIKQIVLDIGSPGGTTTGIAELSAQIKAAADTRGKTVYAFSDTRAASAAEWMASQANETIITGSASVGSIGTYIAFLNPTQAMRQQGMTMEVFKQGKHKALGLPGQDLTQADREYLQQTVDQLNAQFVAAVKMGRPKATEEALTSAKMYDGKDAIKQGLADGIVSSWEEFVTLL